VVEANGSTHEVSSPDGFAESAARSLANGASMSAVARYFDLSEDELAGLLGREGEHPADSRDSAGQDQPRRAASAPTRPAPHRANPTAYSPNRAMVTRRSSSASPRGVRDCVRGLRRRLLLVLLTLVLGAVAGWMTAPGQTRVASTYQATHTLIYEPHAGQSYNIDQVALLATTGGVPSQVAARLHLDRAQVRSAVSAVAKSDVNTISITARNADSQLAAALADATAEELAAEIDGLKSI
jgi:hypothetical protein